MGHSCDFEALAETHGCRVDRCAHGCVHLTIGGVTLRLSPDHARAVAEALSQAGPRLDDGLHVRRLSLC